MPDPSRRGEYAIVVEAVTRRYGALVAVDDLSFSVARGEVVALVGANGAGKTTMLRMLATLLRPDAGRILVDGHDVLSEPLMVRRALGYQTGDTGLYDRLSVREFLVYFGRLHGLARSELDNAIERVIRQLGLAAFVDRPCGTLSTGQRQRASLARAFLHNPAVLVLDEPTSGLDIVSSGFLLDAIRGAADAGHAVLFSTHIMSEVELVCDRAVIIHDGRLVGRGTVAELADRHGSGSFARAFLQLVGGEAQAEAGGGHS